MRPARENSTEMNDIQLDILTREKDDEHPYTDDLTQLSPVEKERMLHAGVDPDDSNRSGTFVMKDQSVTHCNIRQPGVELLSTKAALEKYDGLGPYWWQLLQADTDKFTEHVKRNDARGYFIRVSAGTKAAFPVQSCLFLDHPGVVQSVHNIIIAEEGSELDIITGCTANEKIEQGVHLGVSEIYVHKNARLTYSMIHNWSEHIQVRPRTGILVEEGGTYISNYVTLKPVRDVQMNPLARLVGKGATAIFNSVLVAPPASNLDIGSRVYLEAEETRTEILARALTLGGNIINRGLIVGAKAGVKGHLECQGLVLNPNGRIYTIPELDGRTSGVELSHEAAIGKIAQDEIEYLMARGLSEKEAISIIVHGFLNAEIEGLPAVLKKEIDETVDTLQADAF